MNDEELKQRIKYLVEHGGLWDDPQEDIRNLGRIGMVGVAASLGLHLVSIGLTVFLLLR